jgi:hypothetical protein
MVKHVSKQQEIFEYTLSVIGVSFTGGFDVVIATARPGRRNRKTASEDGFGRRSKFCDLPNMNMIDMLMFRLSANQRPKRMIS